MPAPRYEGSLFLEKMEKEDENKINEKLKYENEESDEEFPPEPFDPYDNKRLHCWVMIQAGKRKVEKHLFIEPSTGVV